MHHRPAELYDALKVMAALKAGNHKFEAGKRLHCRQGLK